MKCSIGPEWRQLIQLHCPNIEIYFVFTIFAIESERGFVGDMPLR